MSLRSAVRRAGVAAGVALAAAAAAQDPPRPTPRPPVKPADYIPPADTPPGSAVLPSVLKVEASTAVSADGSAALPKALAESRTAIGKLRDYTCHLVRQERVGGRLLPEQTCELRVRTQPFAVNVRLTAPKDLSGQETSYNSARSTANVRFRAGGVDGVKYGFATLPKDDAKVTAFTRHGITDTGLAAVLDRVERSMATERRLNHPVQVMVAEYTFGGRPATRYEVFAERPHPARYAYRCLLFIDKETKLPVRFEAYDQPRPGGSPEGELVEVQSFVGLKPNAGLGESAFER